MAHQLLVDDRILYAWCAWDTLFLPELIGKPAQVKSTCPTTGTPVSLSVHDHEVTDVAPDSTVLSFLHRDQPFDADAIATFCHYVHFFANRGAAEQWTSEHGGTFVISLADGAEIARLANATRFPHGPITARDHVDVTGPQVTLRAFTRADLTIVEPWLRDRETRRWLGGPEWPATMLDRAEHVAGEEFRGAVQTGAYRYLAHHEGPAIGYVDCGTFDRCTVYGGEGPDGPIITETLDVPTGSIAFVVDPELRRRGLGRTMISALTQRSELRFVELFEAGVEPENTASRRCLEAAGFHPRSQWPDVEGMLYYRARATRSSRTPNCWRDRDPDSAAARGRSRGGRLPRPVRLARRPPAGHRGHRL